VPYSINPKLCVTRIGSRAYYKVGPPSVCCASLICILTCRLAAAQWMHPALEGCLAEDQLSLCFSCPVTHVALAAILMK
jgi:hypothetical protein